VRQARLTLLGTAGVVLGHTLAYAAVVPDGRSRTALLNVTGHAYWRAAVIAAVLSGVVAAASHVVRSLGPRPDTLPRATARLAAFQVCVFTLMEVSERAVAHQSVASLFDHHVFFVGVAVQLVVAALLAQGLRLLGRAAAALAERARRPPVDRACPPRTPARPVPPPAAAWLRTGGSRAPPSVTTT